jgi:hypothetical protein
MINKLINIFFRSDLDSIATGSQALFNRSLSEDDFAENCSYFIDRTTGLSFRFSQQAFNYSKGHRRGQFALLLLSAVFYPLIGLYALYRRRDCDWGDVLRAIGYYAPLCLGIVIIAGFGLFCPLHAVTLVYSLEHRFLGKSYLSCMNPLIFKDKQNFLSAPHAKVASLRQNIIINLLLVITLCVVRFSPVFMWLKQKALLYLVLSAGAQNIAIVAFHFVFSAAIFAALLFLLGTIQSSSLTDYHVAKCKSMLAHHIMFHVSLLGIVGCYLALMVYGGAIILNPILLLNIISVISVGVTSLLHYWYLKAEAQYLARLIFSGEYIPKVEFSTDPLATEASSNMQQLKSLEHRELSWWSNLYFKLTGKGKVSALIACYKHEIKNSCNDGITPHIFENITITASMAMLMAKIRRVDGPDQKTELNRQLKQAYIKANGAVAAQIGYRHGYNHLEKAYVDCLVLFAAKSEMIQSKVKEDHAECSYEASALSFDKDLEKFMQRIKELHVILSIKDDLGPYEDKARAELRIYKQKLDQEDFFLLRHGEEAWMSSIYTMRRKDILSKESTDINRYIKHIKHRLDAIKADGHHAQNKNIMRFDMACYEHKLLASSWFNYYYRVKLCDLYASHYGLPASIFTNEVIFDLAKANEQARAVDVIYDHVVQALVLDPLKSALVLQPDILNEPILLAATSSYEKRLNKAVLLRRARGVIAGRSCFSIFYWLRLARGSDHHELLKHLQQGGFNQRFNKIELGVLREAISADCLVYNAAVEKAQARLGLGERLLHEANADLYFLKRFRARSAYYLGGYFIKANLFHVFYRALLLIQEDINSYVATVHNKYSNSIFSIDSGLDVLEDAVSSVKSFILSCIKYCVISLLQWLIDIICLPVFACYSLFLSAYYSYREWLPELDKPQFSFILLAWFFTIVVMVLQIAIDIICLPIFAVSYPVWCGFDYLCGAYEALAAYKPVIVQLQEHSSKESSNDSGGAAISSFGGYPAQPNNEVIAPSWLADDDDGDNQSMYTDAAGYNNGGDPSWLAGGMYDPGSSSVDV